MCRPLGILISFFKKQVFREGGGVCVCVCVCVPSRKALHEGTPERQIEMKERSQGGTLTLGDLLCSPSPRTA